MSDNVHNAIRIHHALATKASDYTKKQHVFRLQTADQSEYLFQTSDSKELLSWVETVNFVCAAFSAPPLEGAVGSQKRFQRPLLPSSPTKLLLVSVLTRCECIRRANAQEDGDPTNSVSNWSITRARSPSWRHRWPSTSVPPFRTRDCRSRTTRKRMRICNTRYARTHLITI